MVEPETKHAEHDATIVARRTDDRQTVARGEQHLRLIIGFLRVFIGFITLMYVALIGVLCVHWLRETEWSSLYLALLPGVMLLFLNLVAWSA